MTPRAILLLLLLPGGSLVALLLLACALRRRWIARDRHRVEALIAQNTAVPGKGMAVADERLRVRAEARRKAADGIRARAASVESGTPVSDVLRRVK